MKIIKVPSRLKWALLLLMLALPLAALHAALASQAPWWNLPEQSIKLAIIAAFFLMAPFVIWLAGGRRWALYGLQAVAVAWCGWSILHSLRIQNFWMGPFTLLLGFYWVSIITWIKVEMRRSFFDPGMKWYQGLPKAMPGLVCRIKDKEFRVSRMDRDGAFLFLKNSGSEKPVNIRTRARDRLDPEFEFRGKIIRCHAAPVALLPGGIGIGIKFAEMRVDDQKRLGDFVEALWGEGFGE